MKPDTVCERVRLELMAALDGEAAGAADPHAQARQHLAVCPSCGRWLRDLESLSGRLQRVSYPDAPLDLWARVQGRLGQPEARQPVTYPLWLVGALMVGWRALQLLIDLPFPALHPVVPLTAAIAALWLMACDPLAIETSAPELQKRGV